MSTTYRPVEESIQAVINKVLKKHHGEIFCVGVTVGAVFAELGDDAEPGDRAVKLGGYPCCATIRIVSERDRAQGMPDAQMVIDHAAFQALTDEQKIALIDHELYHLEVRVDAGGATKFDGMNRPKLSMRLHDWQIGGFRAVAERHGENAIEVIEAGKVASSFGQLLFSFAEAA